MRLVASLCLGLVALLASSQSANAAFSFQLVPSSTTITPGGSVTINVFALDDSIVLNQPVSLFTVNSTSLTTGGSANIVFTPALPPNGATGVASATGNFFGTINVTAPNAIGGNQATVSLTANVTPFLFTTSVGGSIGPSNVVTITAVPEPSSLALIGVASVGALIRRRRK